MKVEINDLPNEVLVLIFSKFDLLEKLKLRLVCLRWKCIIENLRIIDLSIVDSKFNQTQKWPWAGLQKINYQNLIYHCNPSWYQQVTSLFGAVRGTEELTGSLWLASKHLMFSRLKSMFLSLYLINDFCFEKYINPHFPILEQFSCFLLRPSRTTRLRLPNLKELSLIFLHLWHDTRIRLEVPNMYKFVTDSRLEMFEFVHPQSVTHLFLKNDDESIVRLSNLEYFSCHQLLNESATFSGLAKLKEIYLYPFFQDERQHDRFDMMVEIDLLFSSQEEARQRFAAINRTKKRLGRYELKMFVNDVDYQYRYETYPDLKTLSSKELIQSYVSGKMVPSVLSLHPHIFFDDLLDAFGDRSMPSDFKLFFSNINEIKASLRTRENVNLFFELLDNYPDLYFLHLNSPFAGLNNEQAIYDSLPFRCQVIQELSINWPDRRSTVDPSFILNFRYLRNMNTNLRVKSNFVRSLFETLKYFRSLALEGTRKILKPKNRFIQQYLLRLTQNGQLVVFYSLSSLLAFYQKEVAQNDITD